MVSIYRLFSILVLVGSSLAMAQRTSEENQPATCGNRLIVGITCEGRYCDDITPICGDTTYEPYDIRWTTLVSEEGDGVADCHLLTPFEKADCPGGPAFISGFSCRGRYCDKVTLQCVALINAVPASFGGDQCRWTDWISEEQGTLRFPSGYAAISMACRGRYCDSKRFLICPIEPRQEESPIIE